MGIAVRCEFRQEWKWHFTLHGSFRRKQQSPLLLPPHRLEGGSHVVAFGVGTKQFDLDVSGIIALRGGRGCDRVVQVAGNHPCPTHENVVLDTLHPFPILRVSFNRF